MFFLQDSEKLTLLIEKISRQQHSPVQEWDPPATAHSKMLIKRNGDWWHDGSQITKPSLVKLFAQILRKEDDRYFLVTPVEKQEITVEDTPFIVTHMELFQTKDSQHPVIAFTTNLDEKLLLSELHPLRMEESPESGVVPYVNVRAQLEARLATSVYYECAELAQEEGEADKSHWWLYSGNYKVLLGAV